MNPVDHPMGGGEGRASGGHPRSRTGKYAKGQNTRTRGKGSEQNDHHNEEMVRNYLSK